MTKQCTNTECNSFLDDNDAFCKLCGLEQKKPSKKGFGLFKKKPEQLVQANEIDPRLIEDLSTARPMIYQKKPDENAKRLIEIENKLDIMLKNHNWLLMSVDSWLQGYKPKPKEEDDEDSEKDI